MDVSVLVYDQDYIHYSLARVSYRITIRELDVEKKNSLVVYYFSATDNNTVRQIIHTED